MRCEIIHSRGEVRGVMRLLYARVVAALLVLLLCTCVFAEPVSNQYKMAGQLYKANQFDSAAVAYENIIRQGYKTPEIYYNLGNCYYKLNNISRSIVNYERALKLAPQDEDVIHNLKLANAKTIDKLVPVPQLGIILSWNNFVSSRAAKGWGMLALATMWLSLLAFTIYLFIGLRRLSALLGTLLLVGSLSLFLLALNRSDKEQNSDTAVLIVPNSFIKSAPDANGNDLFMLHEGIKFQILDKVGDWTKIRLIDGKVGWIERSNFEKI